MRDELRQSLALLPRRSKPWIWISKPSERGIEKFPTNLDKSRVPLAWKVITWLTSPDLMKEYPKHGDCVSPRHSVSQDPEVIAHCPVIPEVDAMASKGELADWQRPPVPELQQIVDVLGSVMHEMLAGKRAPEDAVKESQQEIDRIMRKAAYY